MKDPEQVAQLENYGTEYTPADFFDFNHEYQNAESYQNVESYQNAESYQNVEVYQNVEAFVEE